jgi:hypothetical protein
MAESYHEVYTTSEKGYNNYLFNSFGKTKKVSQLMRNFHAMSSAFHMNKQSNKNWTNYERKGNEFQAQGATPQSFKKNMQIYEAGHCFAY